MLDWNIQSRAHTCQVSGRSFADGEAYHTVLIGAKDGFERKDLCAAVWREQAAQIQAQTGFISHWQGTYAAPPAAPPEAIRKDDAESLLRALLERRDPAHAPAAFILAIMLERKRLLKVKSQLREGGRRVIVYEHPKSGDVFTVVDPDLQLAELEAVQRDVGQLLEHGLPPDPSAPAPVSPEAPAAGPTEEPFNAPSELATLAPA
jgi:hypothetical protein